MAIFFYKAKDNQGKDLKGTVEVKDAKQALALLRERKYTPYFVKEKNQGSFSLYLRKILKRISVVDVSTFTRQLSTMINAGLPLTEALTVLKGKNNTQIEEATGEILKDVQAGSSLANTLKKFPKIFSPVYVALVSAGESAGLLDNILNRMADNLEQQREFKSKIKNAMIYPVIIIIGMAVVMFIMMVFVIPKLLGIYKEFDAQLPSATKILIALSSFMVRFWWLIILAVVGLGFLFHILNSRTESKRKIDQIKFKLPIVGKLQNQMIMAEMTRTFGLLIGAGVPITEALSIVSKTANNVPIEEGILYAKKQVEKGFSISASLAEIPYFPALVSQMLAVGEETGKTDEVLMKVSQFFQSESEESLKGLTTAIEPLIMILLGVGVGFLVIAVIMPIYHLTSSIQ